jgi:hydroxymethylpyrimidine pyrophosphatase-like HAD family hydrolase
LDGKFKKIIAVDFDGCIVENKWPLVGDPILPTVEALKKEKQNGSRIILWTCRGGSMLHDALDACKGLGIELDAVNENLPEIVAAFDSESRKVFADEYWDDRAVKATSEGLYK